MGDHPVRDDYFGLPAPFPAARRTSRCPRRRGKGGRLVGPWATNTATGVLSPRTVGHLLREGQDQQRGTVGGCDDHGVGFHS